VYVTASNGITFGLIECMQNMDAAAEMRDIHSNIASPILASSHAPVCLTFSRTRSGRCVAAVVSWGRVLFSSPTARGEEEGGEGGAALFLATLSWLATSITKKCLPFFNDRIIARLTTAGVTFDERLCDTLRPHSRSPAWS